MTVRSVLQLGRHKIGDTVWTLTNATREPEIPEEDDWMVTEHPRFLYETHWHKIWPQGVALPRLEAVSFQAIAQLLTAELKISELVISSITREYGEYLYGVGDNDDDLIPEFALFDSREAAIAERSRILRLISKWVNQQDQ